MASREELLSGFEQAIFAASPAIYYLTSDHIPKVDDKGEMIFYQMSPNMTSPHPVFLMHSDNLKIFLEACRKKMWIPIDQKEYWKKEERDFHTMMEANAKAYNEQLKQSQDRSEEKAE